MAKSIQTLADVLEALSRHPELAERTRRDLASAVRCFCKVLGLDPAATDASDLEALQAQLTTARPERLGLSRPRWSVVRSQFLRAIEVTGAARPLRTATVPLSPEWQALMAALPLKGQQLALSRFARFCSQEGVSPHEVDQAAFDRFAAALAGASLVRNPAKICRDAAQAWARLPATVLGRPPAPIVLLSPPKSRKRGRHPLEAFPTSFRDDLAAFQGWCVSADPLDDQARPKALRSQTVVSYTSNLHTAADAAVRAGVPIHDLTAIALLTRPEVYLQVLRQLLADVGGKPTANLHGVATVVLIIAKDWLKQSQEQLAELKRLKAKLPKLRPGLTAKNRDLLAAFENKALLARFLHLGDDLWKEAQSDRLPRNQRLVRAQTALLIGILQITPLRRKNMCAVMFGQHITWPNGPNAPALIQIPSAEMKTEINYVGELPLELSRRLHHYRTKLVPALTGIMPQHLFVTMGGQPKKQASVTNRLELILERRLGIPMTMHQFRHLSAKLMLDHSPGAYEAVAQLLGHTGPKNAVIFYGGTDTRRASRHHAGIIEKLREDASGRSTRRRKT